MIERGYTNAITVEHAAHAVYMSKSDFMRFFKQVTGQPFVTYLNQFRVAKAEALLGLGEMSIAEVSQAVGFCDQSYFGLASAALWGSRRGNTAANGTPARTQPALETTHRNPAGWCACGTFLGNFGFILRIPARPPA